MRKVVALLIFMVGFMVLTSCSMEQKYPHGQQVKPENTEEKK